MGGTSEDSPATVGGSRFGGWDRVEKVAAAAALLALVCVAAAILVGGFPPAHVLGIGIVGFTVASRARIDQPGGLQLSMDLQEGAIVAAALLIPAPEVWLVGVVGNGLGQLRRQDHVSVALISWMLPVVGIVPAAWVVSAVATDAPGSSWVLAGLLGSVTHSLVSWGAVRAVIKVALDRPVSDTPGTDLMTSSALALGTGCVGILIAMSAQVGWWSWLVISLVGFASLVVSRIASVARTRMTYSVTLMHLRALADVAGGTGEFLERCGTVLIDAIGCYETRIGTTPAPDAVIDIAVSGALRLSASAIVPGSPLRTVDREMLADAAAIISAGVASLEKRDELSREASTDALTRLGNRRALESAAEAVLRRRATCAVVCIDLNNLKAVNDTLGHTAGDEVLQYASRAIRSSVRSHDVAARIGGDEFVVLIDDAADVAAVVGRLTNALKDLPFPAELHVGASIGWACSPGDGSALEELLAVADERMYAQKRAVRRPAGYVRQS